MTPETSRRGRWLGYLMRTQLHVTLALAFVCNLNHPCELRQSEKQRWGRGYFVHQFRQVWQRHNQTHVPETARGIKELSKQQQRRHRHKSYEIFIWCSCYNFLLPKGQKHGVIDGEWGHSCLCVLPMFLFQGLWYQEDDALFLRCKITSCDMLSLRKVKRWCKRGSGCWGGVVWPRVCLIRLSEGLSRSHDRVRPDPLFLLNQPASWVMKHLQRLPLLPRCHGSVVGGGAVRPPW